MKEKMSVVIFFIVIGFLVLNIGCEKKVNMPPVFDISGKWSPDTLYKNGYKIFNLDSLIYDDDGKDSQIHWSVSSGPLLQAELIDSSAGNFLKLEPMRNQIGTDWVNLVAIDSAGAFSTQTYTISIIEPLLDINLLIVQIPCNDSFEYLNNNLVTYANKERLEWLVSSDTTYLKYRLTVDSLHLYSGVLPVWTAIYFNLYDPDNHINFNRSIPVQIY